MDQLIGMAGLGFHPHHLVARVASTDEVNRMVLRHASSWRVYCDHALPCSHRPEWRASRLSPPPAGVPGSTATATDASCRRHGQRPSISSTSVQLRKVRTSTSPGKEAEARKSKVDRYGLYNVRSNQHFEAEQQRSADSVLIVMLCRSPTDITISRPGDACDKNEHTENLDAGTHETDPVASGGFESG